MKKLVLLFLMTTSQVFAMSALSQEQKLDSDSTSEARETDESVLSPEEEIEYLKEKSLQFNLSAFPQTKWLECDDFITGNYTGINCTNRRGASVILKSFMQDNFLKCVNKGLSDIQKPKAVDLHVQHDGIQGDKNHSPRSLHAEARAVDVDSFVVFYENGEQERIRFKSSSSNAFYKSFRTCWGRTVNQENGCPLINGREDRTGSIGKEDSRHQKHMHVSVPYCVNGKYAGNYFRR